MINKAIILACGAVVAAGVSFYLISSKNDPKQKKDEKTQSSKDTKTTSTATNDSMNTSRSLDLSSQNGVKDTGGTVVNNSSAIGTSKASTTTNDENKKPSVLTLSVDRNNKDKNHTNGSSNPQTEQPEAPKESRPEITPADVSAILKAKGASKNKNRNKKSGAAAAAAKELKSFNAGGKKKKGKKNFPQ